MTDRQGVEHRHTVEEQFLHQHPARGVVSAPAPARGQLTDTCNLKRGDTRIMNFDIVGTDPRPLADTMTRFKEHKFGERVVAVKKGAKVEVKDIKLKSGTSLSPKAVEASKKRDVNVVVAISGTDAEAVIDCHELEENSSPVDDSTNTTTVTSRVVPPLIVVGTGTGPDPVTREKPPETNLSTATTVAPVVATTTAEMVPPLIVVGTGTGPDPVTLANLNLLETNLSFDTALAPVVTATPA